ncbi:MFS transporter [Paraburkholderia tropica]|uniref:MFS transporter n=1 Tax=Paraburkholderia tropica TaxID=92647 RepID=UPI002AB17D66|nr:MFS transporter [Paraburkholderia tropica]
MTEQIRPSSRIKSIQRGALIMLVIAGAVNTIDRASLAIANPMIRKDLGLSVAEMGVLLSAFLWAYAFSQLPVGVLVDRLGPRKLLAAGLAVWSSAQLVCGFVGNTVQFAIARAVLGVGEAPQFPAGARVVRDWFSASERGRAIGIFTCASQVGTGLAAPLLTTLILVFGWRWTFVIMGGLGLLVAVMWVVLYRNPAEVTLTESEHAYRTDGKKSESATITFAQWKGLFASGTTWGLVVGYFGVIYVNWLFNTWLPGYLQMERHMSIAHVGWAAFIPYVFAVIGSVSSGYLVDFLAARRMSLARSRKYPLCVFLVLQTVLVVLAARTPSNAVAIACLSGALFCGTAASASAWALVTVLAPPACTGSLGSLQNFGGYIGGALAPIVTGLIVQHSGSFVPALYVGAGMSLFSACVYLLFVRRPVPLSGEPSAQGGGADSGMRSKNTLLSRSSAS